MTSKMKLLDEWIEKLVYPGEAKDFIKEMKGYGSPEETMREFCFYTDSYRYRIFAIDRKADTGYLGCQVSARKTRAGEDWFRGNDLGDGPLGIETWEMILKSIVRYELVKLSEYKKPSAIPE
jgi:hypothetical protein